MVMELDEFAWLRRGYSLVTRECFLSSRNAFSRCSWGGPPWCARGKWCCNAKGAVCRCADEADCSMPCPPAFAGGGFNGGRVVPLPPPRTTAAPESPTALWLYRRRPRTGLAALGASGRQGDFKNGQDAL